MKLPDCAELATPGFALTSEEKRDLVLRIAKDGEAAIDAFIREREAAGDSLVAQKVRRLRDELVKRAEELKALLRRGKSAEAERLNAEYAAAFAELEARRRAGASALESLDRETEGAVSSALARSGLGSFVLSEPPPQVEAPWWIRARRLLRRLLAWILLPLRFILGLFSRAKPVRPKQIPLAIPGAAGGSLAVAGIGDRVAMDPALRRRVRDRLRADPPRERLRRAWERLLGRDDYESIVARAMQAIAAEDAERARAPLRERRAEVEREIARALEDEERRKAERERALESLERREAEKVAQIERDLAQGAERELKREILDDLKLTGFVKERAGKVLPTVRFLDAFAAVVYDQETRRAGGASGGAAGTYAEGIGNFTRGPMRSAMEASHMDVVASLARSRTRHPHVKHLVEDDVLVYREEREALQHVVVILDRSGSMEENGRLEAAKRAVLALHHAVRSDNPRNRVDLIEMETSVRRIDLLGAWEATPKGFTNTGGALRVAREILEAAKSDRGLVYLVTDGLPEAYTTNGEDVAGRPERAMAYAIEQARLLKRTRALAGFVVLLLEPEEEMYVAAATRLAGELGGHVVSVTPDKLARALLGEHSRVKIDGISS